MTEIQPFAPESAARTCPRCSPWSVSGRDCLRNRYGETNPNGRSYGGQVLGQAMMAASMTASENRLPSMMQFLFLQGARPTQPMDFEVDSLQEGKRFSSRLVRGTEDFDPQIFSAQVTFGMPLASPEHSAAVRATGATPQDLDAPSAVLSLTESDIGVLGGYAFRPHPLIDFRMVDTVREGDLRAAEPALLDQVARDFARLARHARCGVCLPLRLVDQLHLPRGTCTRVGSLAGAALPGKPEPHHLVSSTVSVRWLAAL